MTELEIAIDKHLSSLLNDQSSVSNELRELTRRLHDLWLTFLPKSNALEGADASAYLLAAQQTCLEYVDEIRGGWPYYKWLWFSRRTSDRYFEGSVAGNVQLERMALEMLAFRRSDSYNPRRALPRDGEFRVDEHSARRLARHLLLSRAFVDLQRCYRMCAKGAKLKADSSRRATIHHPPRTEASPELRAAVADFDQRNDRCRTFTNTGTPLLARRSALRPGELGLILVGPTQGGSALVPNPFSKQRTLISVRYGPSVVELASLGELLCGSRVRSLYGDLAPIGGTVAMLLLTFSIASSHAEVLYPGILGTGYFVVPHDTLTSEWCRLREDLLNILNNLLDSTTAARIESFETPDRMVEEEGLLLPSLQTGPPVSRINETWTLVDLLALTQVFLRKLHYPTETGLIANHRAKLFEGAVQAAIDNSSFCPSADLRRLHGKTLRRHRESITDIDAIASDGSLTFLISCKSILYSEAYDRGDFAVVRNVRDNLVAAASEWNRRVEYLTTNRRGDNYDLTSAGRLVPLLVTPSVFFLESPLRESEVVPGLRLVSSYDEFCAWLKAP